VAGAWRHAPLAPRPVHWPGVSQRLQERPQAGRRGRVAPASAGTGCQLAVSTSPSLVSLLFTAEVAAALMMACDTLLSCTV